MRSSSTLVELQETHHEFSLAELPATIGRAGDVEISVSDRWVSRRHCCIERVDDETVIRDLGSSHGTFLNGRRVDQAVLQSGDRLGVGLTSFVASVDDDRVALQRSPAC